MRNNRLLKAMMEYYGGDPKRISHFIKVYQFAKMIGEEEKLDDKMQFILETAAIVHDIGIKISEEKHGIGVCDGKKQEKYGPKAAEDLLTELGYEQTIIDRVSYLVGHHHTYANVDGLDYQILLEADFLVNLYEEGSGEEAIRHAYARIFRTDTGKAICREMYVVK